ncbi:MAG: zinc metallopeptidase [Proteobacteria bacterium]|nr:zinc metallopeptidase [Pseudomonadota bacterium]
MRLDDIEESTNVEDRRGQSSGGFGGGFGLPSRSGGGLGFGTLIILGIVAWVFGISPSILIGGAEMVNSTIGSRTSQQAPAPRPAGGKSDADQQFVSRVLKSTETVFSEQLAKQLNVRYQPPRLVMFSGATRSACGSAQSAMGPFYCPLDKTVYLDTSFFAEMKNRLRAGGDFAYAYVIAHEVGHHVENQLGILPKVQEMQQRVGRKEANALSVRVELMADCLAGIWAHFNQTRLDMGDIEEALNAANQIGDDKLQKASQGYAVPDSFTHGSSAQRMEWFTRGYKSGQIRACDTFGNRGS